MPLGSSSWRVSWVRRSSWHAVRRLGGVTGDVIGAAIEVALLTSVVAASVLASVAGRDLTPFERAPLPRTQPKVVQAGPPTLAIASDSVADVSSAAAATSRQLWAPRYLGICLGMHVAVSEFSGTCSGSKARTRRRWTPRRRTP